MDSWKLVHRLAEARRDDPLWGELLRRCELLIRRSLAWQLRGRFRGGPAALDDVTQEVMARLLARNRQGLTRFLGEQDVSFEGYIRRIAENLLHDQRRRDLPYSRIERQFGPEEFWKLEAASSDPARTAGESPDSAVRTREVWEEVESALRQASRDQRDHALNRLLFRLYFWEGCSIPQIAALRAVPLSNSSVARRIIMLRRALRRALAHRGFGPSPRPAPANWRPRRRRRPRLRRKAARRRARRRS